MSLLEDPGTKKTYDDCKYIVKMWEHNFTKIFKRIPSKLDIKEAPVEVRRAYREYFNIKAAVIEESFMDVEGILKDESNPSIIEPIITKCSQDSNITSDSDLIAQIQLSNDDFNIEQTPENRKNSITSPEDGFSDNQVSEDVWGTHLNKKKSPVKEKVKEISGPSEPVLSISKKLFCGSKFSKPKRNPRKSYLSNSTKKTNSSTQESVADSGTFSFASFKSEDAIQYLQNEISTNEITSNNTKSSSTFQSFFSQSISLNITDKFKEKSQLRTVNSGWLQRISNNTGISLENPELPPQVVNNTKLDYDSDDIIGNSDEEESSTFHSSIFHVAKKAKLDIVDLKKTENSVNNTLLVDKIDNISRVELNTTLEDNISNISLKENITDNLIDSIENIETRKKEKKKVSKKTIKKSNRKLKSPKSNKPSPLRRSLRENKIKSSLEELESGDEEDPFASENLSDDPDFSLVKNKKELFNFKDVEDVPEKTNNVKAKKGKQKNRKKPIENKPEENPIYELEYSVKRRVVTPRYESISKIVKEKLAESAKKLEENLEEEEEISINSLPKSKQQQAKEKLQAKIAAGKLNENFVTINLKKKVFVKGNRGMNYSKYKKSMWKKKKNALYGPDMNMGGCDGGKLICFNCGLEGHFAARCKAIKGDGLLPLDAHNEDECALPSLEEASKMASESNLTIRKPKLVIEKSENEENEANSSSAGSEAEWEDDIDDELLLAEINKLEEHVKKLDVQKYIDNCKEVKPYYQLKIDTDDIIDTPEEVYEALNKFGYSSFRSGQEKAIMRTLSGKSTLVTLSTGSGKSLCYQLPAYLYSQREPCISLIISPLVSLMEDQITGIPKFLKAACLHTNQTEKQRQKILDAISLGELNVLLVSPEAVVAGEKRSGFGSLLRKLPPIAFACIDEAHCVSQWSHNFRPSYLLICRVLKECLGVKTILGLTATATTTTSQSIISSLGIVDGLDGVITDTPLPDNLNLTVSKDSNRDRALVNILMSDRFKNCHSIIVYCTRRDECERIAGFLRTSLKSETIVEHNDSNNKNNKKRKRLNLQAEFYHAGLSASRRRTVQNSFMSSELRVVVATVAFGMGINKSDIRAVIHYNMPNSFESYVQEVGRAGRDGFPAQCHVFLDSQGRDENELCRHIHANSIDRHAIRKLLQKVFVPCSCKNDCPKHEVSFSIEETIRALDLPEENISTLLCYLELHKNKYIELLSPAYTKCKVVSYGGPQEIRKAAKDCPPLAMALALHPPKEREENVAEFPIIDVASAMGWDSGICKHKLKNLEWISVDNRPKRSTLSVQFSNLGFRFLAPGNLSGEKLDEALDSLHEIVGRQEIKSIKQLHAIYELLSEVGEKSYLNCVDKIETEMESSIKLKEKIREYFKSEDPLKDIEMKSAKSLNEEQILNDIKILMAMYKDNQFTGKAIARIFHGIQSPNYPAVIWGRCKFWRSHLDDDFHEICRLATKEILRMR